MSEQRKLRTELKQGLHQFLMTLYHSYTQSMSHEDALQEIAKCIREEHEYFTKHPLAKTPTLDFPRMIKTLEIRARKEKDATVQMGLYQDAETLMNAQDILSKYNLQEDPHDN